MPISLSLPVDQNWSCHACGGCCKQHGIVITEAERDRVASQGWTEADGIPADWYVEEKSLRGGSWFRMANREDGSCVFLDEKGLCRIHGKFGEPAKPLACQIYPYVFHPAGGRVTVSMRFSCPSVVQNLGTAVADQRTDLQQIAKQVVPDGALDLPPPDLCDGQPLDWSGFRTINRALLAELTDASVPLATRLLRALTWVRILPQADVGSRKPAELESLLTVFRDAAAVEVRRDAAKWPRPGRTAMTHFRLLTGQYARRDTHATKAEGLRKRWQLLKSAIGLTTGRGVSEAIGEEFASVDLTALFGESAAFPPDVEAMLTRLLRVKVEGLHYCGRPFYGYGLVDGFCALAAMVAAVSVLARWNALTREESLSTEHFIAAVTTADHNHGFSPAFAHRTFLRRLRFFDEADELRPLVRQFVGCDSSES